MLINHVPPQASSSSPEHARIQHNIHPSLPPHESNARVGPPVVLSFSLRHFHPAIYLLEEKEERGRRGTPPYHCSSCPSLWKIAPFQKGRLCNCLSNVAGRQKTIGPALPPLPAPRRPRWGRVWPSKSLPIHPNANSPPLHMPPSHSFTHPPIHPSPPRKIQPITNFSVSPHTLLSSRSLGVQLLCTTSPGGLASNPSSSSSSSSFALARP